MLLRAMVLLLSLQYGLSEEGLRGINIECSKEGEIYNASDTGFKCFDCMCKNGSVQCEKKMCPLEQGCYMLLGISKDGCCQLCKGCMHNGIEHASGTEWTDPKNPCKVFTCKAGVITESQIQCYTPCRNPVGPRPGQCCKTCPGCQINGRRVARGREVTIPEDPCVKCQCQDGYVTCSKQACPVLHCPKDHIKRIPGNCCPHCEVSRQFIELTKGQCMLGSEVYLSGKSFSVDRCTHCTCLSGTSVCRRHNCPVLDCPPESQKFNPSHCCPHCAHMTMEVHTTCVIGGRSYQDGETWQLDPCKSCRCHQGMPRCAMETCQTITCPANHKLQQVPGECCPRCIENDGVCVVFGDPHYRTYDGKFFSFQGSCKYLLSADCKDHTFSIRVTNDPRATAASSWTKTVSIKIGEHKVNLGQKMRVKVDGVRVEVPHSLGNVITVNKSEETLHVYTHIGVRVEWDGTSLLEVYAPTSYKEKLCGLCGNFNNKKHDDLNNRQGRMVINYERFGLAWRVGGKKACARGREDYLRDSQCSQRQNFERDSRLCKKLRSETFQSCHAAVSPTMYLQSCVIDMCECPNERCYCDSFNAYVHECQRHGINIQNWRSITDCKISWAKHKRQRLH